MVILILAGIVLGIMTVALVWAQYRHMKEVMVGEDSAAVTVDKHGFIKRVLPQGKHILGWKEKIEFKLVTKPQLTTNCVQAVASSDGILINVNWSGVYTLAPETIVTQRSQKLRGLRAAEKAIARNVDIQLRRLAGNFTVGDLFKPQTREALEHQLKHIISQRLEPMGIVLNGLDMQVIELPGEVAEALNKAKAMEALDGAIRHLDPTTREVVRSAYHLDDLLHWERFLPLPNRLSQS